MPLPEEERAKADARPEKLALGGAGGFQARTVLHPTLTLTLVLVIAGRLAQPAPMLPAREHGRADMRPEKLELGRA